MPKSTRLNVLQGVSFASDEKQAVQELYDKIFQPKANVVIFFCSSKYELKVIEESLSETFQCPTIGCTTSGEITSDGYWEGSLVGVSIASEEIVVHTKLIDQLDQFSLEKAESIADSIRQELQLSSGFNKKKMFGYLLIDGLSMQEENTIGFLYSQFEDVSIIGGSAGDDLNFKETRVYFDGKFRSNAAIFSIIETTLPFHIFKTQHFQPTGIKLVITEADPAKRCVMEINGEPAAQEYAEMLDIDTANLSPKIFSNHPVMLSIGGEYYVRSIQHVNKDNSLAFYCAIDNGLVLTVAEGVGLVQNLEKQLQNIKQEIPNMKLMLGFDCILRRLEMQEKNLLEQVTKLIKNENFVGFSTYGEQYNSVHVNQTLTGVALGE